jgi:elongator complex protein 3
MSNDSHVQAYKAIIKEVLAGKAKDRRELDKLKTKVCAEYSLSSMPRNADILSAASPGEREALLGLLRTKPSRTSSGIAIVAVMAKPYPCPKDSPCIYCPGGVGSVFGNTPQSYTGHEPATMRAIQNNFEPKNQVINRLNQINMLGHNTDKVELIIMGGTFPAMPVDYQEWFTWQCLDAITGKESSSLMEAQRFAETSSRRNTGITVETRPDFARREQVEQMLKMGVTRVELGVQTVFENIYKLVDRGHTIDDVVSATAILKDSGFKIVYHVMPGLPGSNYERDLETFKTIFMDERFKPDMLKIYPTLVVKGTRLYDLWKSGEYEAYDTDKCVQLLTEVSLMIPPWIRVQRMQRDIPARLIEAGPKRSDLHDLVQKELTKRAKRCPCIRCREVGHVYQTLGLEPDPFDVHVKIHLYEASESDELFISCEDVHQDILLGFLRLRIPSEEAYRPEIKEMPSAIVRELHVYGRAVKVGYSPTEGEWQHRGVGSLLLEKAENFAKEEYDTKKMLVMSAIGVREYYKKFGYTRDGPYVSKRLGTE